MKRISALLLALSLSLPCANAQLNNTAPSPLRSVLPNCGVSYGVNLQQELQSGTVLPAANGGTGSASFVLPVTVPNGGTGDTTLTSHGVLLGNGTGVVGASTAGTTGQAFVSGGASANGAYGVTLPAGGGTGSSTAPTNGQIPIGSTSSGLYAPAAITQGIGIAVTNGASSISIATNPVTGTAGLTSGASGTISSATVTASSIIVATYKGSITNSGQLSVTPGTGSFTINSTNASDGNTVMWYLVKP